MATLTIITWIAAIAIFVWLIRKVINRFGSLSDEAGIFTVSFVAWLIIVFGITAGLVKDIYGVTLSGNLGEALTWWINLVVIGDTLPSGISRARVLFMGGLVALGLCSLAAIAYNLILGRNEDVYPTSSGLNFGSTGSFIIQGVGLVASILGIISFYLDYFR